ncbi:TPA: hypothetical protein KP562_001213 [Clostridioides difficile]|uniref:hypothetical protein n=1 Tax=unclassified Clostridioides TaxID=2635829 RepID=UPI001C158F3B|nr:hypothetical protein [Clostridioides sp. ZZV14-6045]MCC0730056.1 hypothetical protein [Clostridioides sp. ZZV14-6048]MCC0741718.1 hypothetical protein [Clostridioides sp. ZZV14-6044]HBG3257030.1 hypothetical protein [Clostridioides difficile]HBY3283422.1 hypothetical protein [Clostridioides difficile]
MKKIYSIDLMYKDGTYKSFNVISSKGKLGFKQEILNTLRNKKYYNFALLLDNRIRKGTILDNEIAYFNINFSNLFNQKSK